ncbi:MAG: hypothetical protein M3O66_06055 [Verrucomicrobiota bacterium]|nr:hypothetical protein [Verrucomicrobiota bacterium]
MLKPILLFAPGAGAPSSHPWMEGWKERLTTIGCVEVFDYPYMREGRKRPDPLPRVVQGTRDSLCPLDILQVVRAEMKAPTVLHVVEGGDHSLLVSKRHLRTAGETQEDVDQRILQVIARFVHRFAKPGGNYAANSY